MDYLPIAELSPDLSEPQTKQIQAIVTLIWPFSSSTRQCALLLAEPDFRLRRRKGQVRVRFAGSSAKSIAETGVGIGDEVYLSLRGARFVEEDVGITTPGRSIDWELSYAQTLVAEIRRNGSSIAKLELFDAAPTPTPGTPVHREPMVTPLRTNITSPDMNQRWASPAFMKRARLSGSLSLDAGFDPLSRDSEDGPEKKRRRKSYRDWGVWQYVARTPSPEKEEYNGEDDLLGEESPLGPPQIPETPASITSLAPSESNLPPENNFEGSSNASNQASRPLSRELEDGTVGAAPARHAREEIIKTDGRDADYYDLYAGPDEVPPNQYAYGGDTESDTEKEPSDQELEPLTHVIDFGAAGSEHIKNLDGSIADVPEPIPNLDNPEIQHRGNPSIEGPQELPHRPEHTPAVAPAQENAMPPPALASLQTSFQPTSGPQLLTPVGQQPRSPVIMPLDSSTLPMPSPFPGDHGGRSLASYFESSPASHMPDRESAPVQLESNDARQREHERESIVESSFRSSTNFDSKRPHQSEFTDVRFTFGLDGAAFSSQKDLSLSPEPPEQIVLTSQESPGTVDHDEHQEDLAEEVADELAIETFEGLRDELHEDLTDTENEELEHELREEFREEFVDDLAADLEAELPYSDQESHPHLSEARPGASELEEAIKLPERFTSEIPLEQEQPETHRHDAEPHSEVVMISSDTEPSASEEKPENKNGGDHSEGGTDELASSDRSEREVHTTDEKPFAEVACPMEVGPSVRESGRVFPPTATEIVDMGPPTESEASDDEIPENNRRSTEDETSKSVPRHAAQAEHRPSNRDITQTATHPEANHAVDIGISSFEGDVARRFSKESQPTGDRAAQDISIQGPQTPTKEPYSSQPDIKVETIEESTAQFHDSVPLHEDSQPLGSASEQLVIAVPEGLKMGELHYKSVPATGPARNTRSRTKQSTSPAKDDMVSSQSDSRSRRSKMSNVSTVAKPTSQATPSPSRELKSTSPYYTRSQSKLLSPTKPIETERRRPRKRREYKKEPSRSSSPVSDGASHSSSFRNEYVDLPDSIFQPSQELGTLQGRFRNVRSVKDSEEGSLHSENSLSTVPMSDDHEGYGAPADFTYRDAAQPSSGQYATPRTIAARPAYSGKANEGTQISSSPPTSPFPGRLKESRPSDSVQQKSLLSNTMPITPDGTQSQSQDIPRQLQHTLPMSPQLTQKTTFGHASFTTKPDVSAASQKDSFQELHSQPAPGSQASTPSVRSEDMSGSEHETATQLTRPLEPPSVGLSTPISYYTPLRDLTYFLNRSSQFHTSSNPDVLALVVSATTPARRAPKGARHYGTTLHVSDLSTFPDSTTVQVFRPFNSALPIADEGDVVLLRAFQVKSLNRKCVLVSGEESGWCVWRWGKPVWGIKQRQAFGALRAREEVKGPAVEMGEGEWREVERLRAWWVRDVKGRIGKGEEGVGENGTSGDGKEDGRVDRADVMDA